MIGIVSHIEDLHAAAVRSHLDCAGVEVALIDTAAFPAELALTTWQDQHGWSGEWGVDGLDADGLRAMWWRRPQPFTLDSALTLPSDRGFSLGECAAAVGGLWACLDAVWVNDPVRDEAASRKMWQLKLAAKLGLRVPRTCVTNSVARAREFLQRESGTVIYKPFSGTVETWRETRPVRQVELDLLDQVCFAPVIFQEAIEGGRDVRVTIVDRQLFAAEIRAADTSYQYDFRIDTGRAPISPTTLPKTVADRLLALMDCLGLWFGAADFRIAPDGELVFLEVNPAGQWLFVELPTGMPIAAAIADLLVRLDRRPAGSPDPYATHRGGAG